MSSRLVRIDPRMKPLPLTRAAQSQGATELGFQMSYQSISFSVHEKETFRDVGACVSRCAGTDNHWRRSEQVATSGIGYEISSAPRNSA